MRFLKTLLLLIVINLVSVQTYAQSFLSGKDLSQFKVEMLSEADISKIKERLQGSELTLDQLKTQATAKGLPAAEFEKLKTRLSASSNSTNTIATKLEAVESNRQQSVTGNTSSFNEEEAVANNLVFGSELFQNTVSLASNANIATPLNYEVGPNDVLKVVLYGIQEFATELKVSYEGSVTVPNVGVIRVAGLTIEAAANKIKQQMARTAYKTLASGESKLSVTLSNIRTIHITIIGAKRPGTYDVSSLTTLFSALSIAGGPSPIGTYRNIELLRNNQPIRKVDLYRFILNGDQSDNVGLKDNDVIRIPAYQNRVEVNGQIKRPGIFELGGTEKFKNILEYAGGFDDAAYTENVKVIQKNGRELQVKDLSKTEFANYTPQGGDVFVVSKILNRFQNRIKLTGAVYRPDTYELTEGMRVSDLIKKADGLKEDAYTGGAQLFRLKPNLVREMLSINLSKALAGDKTQNIYLQREDELYVSSVLDLRDSFNVTIIGEVHNQGKFPYVEGMKVKDLITLAGGTTAAANSIVEVVRIYKKTENSKIDNIISTILTTELDKNLFVTSGNEDIILEPYDIITISQKKGYSNPETVSIIGQVNNTGTYGLLTRSDRVSSIIQRSGGFISDAYLPGAILKRGATNIALNLSQAMKLPGSIEDIVLVNGDQIFIPKIDNKVSISGAVLNPTTITYDEGLTVKECISAAGGLTEMSIRNKAYVLYANGRAKQTKAFGFIRINPKVEPGSQIIVPVMTEKKEKAITTIIQFTTIIAQLATAFATVKILSK